MDIAVNYVAVVLAGVVSMVVGFLWYSPMLFGNQWAKLSGFTKEGLKKAQKKAGPMYVLSFVASLVTAYVLTHVMALSENTFHYARVNTGVTTAFWVWVGFVAPVQLTDVLFMGKKWSLFFINTGYQLASLVVMGVALGLM